MTIPTEVVAIVGAIILALLLILAVEAVVPWLFKILGVKRWWNSGLWLPPAQIEYRAFTKDGPTILAGRPVGIMGMHLVLHTAKGRELVGPGSALDRDEFWKTWKYFGGQTGGWVDEQGEPFDFTE